MIRISGADGVERRSSTTVASRLCALALVATAVVLALPASAYAAAVFSAATPTPNVVIPSSPSIVSVFVDDTSGILQTTSMSVDGVPQTTYVDWPGYWQDPDCMEVWIVDDYTVATVSAYTSGLAEGVHTASVTVRTASSGTSTFSWSFTVDFPAGSAATFSAKTPASGATVVGSTTFRVTVDAFNPITGYDCSLYLDGAKVSHLSTTVTANRVTLFTSTPRITADGAHTVLARAVDNGGVVTDDTWTFTTAIPPSMTGLQPASGSIASVARPVVGLTLSDNTPGQLTLRLQVDDVQVHNSLVNQGAFTWTPASDYASGSSHTVVAQVTDAAGLTTSSSWSFQVVAPGAMATSVCMDCHTTYPTAHSSSNCTACHPAPAGDCLGCHDWNHGSDYIAQRACTSCHTRGYPTVPDHNAAATNAKHVTASTSCNECHSTSLIVEHAKYPSDSSFKYQCTVCHASATPAVQAAIAANDTSCTACHLNPDHTALHVSATSVTCFGAGCHDASRNLITVHTAYAGPGSENPEFLNVCAFCHQNPAVDTSTSGTSCTPACHSGATHSQYASQHTPTVASAACTECHTVDLTGIHGAYDDTTRCALCHSDSENWSKSADCGSCHEMVGHETLHEGTLTATFCDRCHAANLITEHVTNRGLGCAVCHDSAAAVVAASSSVAVQTSGMQVALAAPDLAVAEGESPHVTLAANVAPEDIAAALASGVTACGACHDPIPHGTTQDCGTCHMEIPATTDGSEASTSTAEPFTEWDPTDANAAVATPHKGYATNTTKCAVCHAVHTAPAGGELLLRTTVASACEFCHVLTAIGGVTIYDGSAAAYYDVENDFGHNRTSKSSCTGCHSVHGANTLAGANSEKILRDWAHDGSASSYSTAALDAWPDPASLVNDDAQITAWCTGCHKYYVATYETTLSFTVFDHHDTYDWTWATGKSHIMTDTAGGYGNTVADAAVQGTDVAFAPSSYCTSCHDAGETDHGVGVVRNSFPHYTPDYYRFMSVGDSAASAASPNVSGTVDGLCLKCHRADASTGVGIDF